MFPKVQSIFLICIIALLTVIAIELAIMDNAVAGGPQKVIICDPERVNTCAGVLEPFVNLLDEYVPGRIMTFSLD